MFNILSTAYSKNWSRIPVYVGHIVPRYVVIEEKTPLTLYCGSRSAVNWTFMPDYLPIGHRRRFSLPERHRIGYKNVSLFNLYAVDSGFYYCEGLGHDLNFLIYMQVKVVNYVSFGQVLPTRIEVTGGSSVTLKCGSVKPVEWFGVNYYEQKKTIEGNILTLHQLKKEHSGRYMCRGYNHLIKSIFHCSTIIIVDSNVERINRHYRHPSNNLTIIV